jgi:hypothetical protein
MAMKESPVVASSKSPLVGSSCRFGELLACAVTVIAPTLTCFTAQGALLKSARERMNIVAAYHHVGTYRGAAELCGTPRADACR